ncbi:hypothetical protein VNO78_16180 [Psophocarpus tetragonolobus]|uniref:Uncharacterized protein n=1 Tax=Psophocarpus tetragonolobus TaxID=3891 RepID=A0AAN9SGP8_PSOTE
MEGGGAQCSVLSAQCSFSFTKTLTHHHGYLLSLILILLHTHCAFSVSVSSAFFRNEFLILAASYLFAGDDAVVKLRQKLEFKHRLSIARGAAKGDPLQSEHLWLSLLYSLQDPPLPLPANNQMIYCQR